MSPRQWCALLLFYASYLIFGAGIFYHMERAYEIERRLVELQERIDINELLTKYTSPDDEDIQQDILTKVTGYCGKAVTNHTLDEFEDPLVWSFYHSVFFAFTVCSTLGYGNIAPTHTLSRYFMILYALIGIPVNGILYAYLGEYFGETFVGAYNRYKAYKMANNKNYVPRRWGMIAQITLYLVPAAVVLIFLPACLFTYFEDWPYSVSVYYSFVTLSTIGFGDFIPTFQPHQERVFGVYFQIYQAFIIIWFVFGLSYLLMLISFIARGMRSKKITRLEHQLSENIKLTHQRIWTGVSKDVSYLRHIFNEIYMMRFKPVYAEDEDGYVYNILTRSESCPNLEMYHPRYVEWPSRKRAFSEHNIDETLEDRRPPPMGNRKSDTDLIRIDKQRTFETAHVPSIDTSDVLARVVQALGNIGMIDRGEGSPLGGIHGFSDSQILAEECVASDSDWPSPTVHRRNRAVSASVMAEARPNEDQHEWTWNGTNEQIQELRKMRAKLDRPNDLFRQAVTGNTAKQTHSINIEISPPQSQTPPPPPKKSFLSKINLGRLSPSDASGVGSAFEPPQEARRYLEHTARGRESTNSLRKQYLNATSRGRPSIFAAAESPDQDLLENTTIADLIRALEVAHIQENTPESLLTNSLVQPSRFTVEKIANASRRASMYPSSAVNDIGDHSRRMSQLDKERDKLDELPSVNRSHVGSRRASMFPANYKSFQKLTETILSDHTPPNSELRPSPLQFNGARRASMAPRRIGTGVDRPVGTPGRRVSLIPGAGRHAIPERLLREYAHVPQETRDLGRHLSAQRAGRPQQPSNLLCVPMGGSIGLSMAAAYPGGVGAHRRRSVVRPNSLARDKPQSASSPHLSVRHDLQQQQQQGVSPKARNIRTIFSPFGGDVERVAEVASLDESSGDGSTAGAYTKS